MNCELKRMDPALETIKTSFLLNFRTGNVLLDTMINGLIIMAVGYVTTSMGVISRNFTLTKMREGFLWVMGYRKRSIFISGMITRTAEDNRPVFSTRFKAVLHKIKKLELAKAKITGLKEIKIASEQDLFVEQFRSFYFTAEVEGNILCFDDEKNGGKTGGSYTEENYIIEVFSWTSSLQELKELLEVWEKDYEESFVRQTITLTGKVVEMKTESSHFDFSDRMFAVMHKISTLDFHSSAHDLEELHLKEPGRVVQEDPSLPDFMQRNVSRLVPREFKFNDKVDGEIQWSKDTGDDNNWTNTIVYTIKISSVELTSKELADLVTRWEKEYEDFKFSGSGLRYYVYNPREGESSDENFDEFSFESGKTFDNVFFEQKESLLSRLRFFLDNEDWCVITCHILFTTLPLSFCNSKQV